MGAVIDQVVDDIAETERQGFAGTVGQAQGLFRLHVRPVQQFCRRPWPSARSCNRGASRSWGWLSSSASVATALKARQPQVVDDQDMVEGAEQGTEKQAQGTLEVSLRQVLEGRPSRGWPRHDRH